MTYQQFLINKFKSIPPAGIDTKIDYPGLFPHQRDLIAWSLRRGRAAIFADTGLGKTRMQLAWADSIHRTAGYDILILAPLAVAEQTVREGETIGIEVSHVRDSSEVRPGINITNYDRLHKFDASRFGGVVLDESSIIKHHTAKTLQTLLDVFQYTPYKLCATATPAPNDWTELGNHAEFLGIRSRMEMLAEFFIHDGGDTQNWRLKGHAQDIFWQWVSSWSVLLRSPADLGYDASAYALPPLNVYQHSVEASNDALHDLFPMPAQTLMDRRAARKQSLKERVDACGDRVNADRQPWIVWCDLNAEGDALTSAIDGAVQVAGSDDMEVKEARLKDFANGKIRVLVSKPSICGFGLNWQHCARMAFVGVTDSFEAYYQAVRRCWRFGQHRPVEVHIFASEQEGAIVANLRRKEADAVIMGDRLSEQTREFVQDQVLGHSRETDMYQPAYPINLPTFMDARYEVH